MDGFARQEEAPTPVFFVVSRVGDVTGDGVPDIVLLLASRPDPDSPFLENITLAVQDGVTGELTEVPLGLVGFEPTLFLGDFTGDRVLDIMVQVVSGGSGGFIFAYVYSFLNGKPRRLFDYEAFNESSRFDVIFRDDFRVDVIDRATNDVFTIDISHRPPEYLSQIYDAEGNLLAPREGQVQALSALWPVIIDASGIFRLLAIQRITGLFSADTLGEVQTLLVWNGAAFIRERVVVCVPPVPDTGNS